MAADTIFSRFTELPVELQLQIWEACVPASSMHIFDVCSPASETSDIETSPSESFENPSLSPDKTSARSSSHTDITVFLDKLQTDTFKTEARKNDPRPTKYVSDPSMYRFVSNLYRTSRMAQKATKPQGQKTCVYLPRQGGSTIEIPRSDTLMFRFRHRKEAGVAAARTIFRDGYASQSPLSAVLEGQWSPELADTLRAAPRIALDLTEPWISEVGSEIAFEEISFLACTMQANLEVLYLVDNCIGRCTSCGNADARARDLGEKGVLWECLNYQDKSNWTREPDVIQGVGQRYVEISDLEALGWSDTHPSVIFARIFDEAVRSQQAGPDRGKFKGVRFLMVEDEGPSQMEVKCQGRKLKEESVMSMAMGLMPGMSSVWAE